MNIDKKVWLMHGHIAQITSIYMQIKYVKEWKRKPADKNLPTESVCNPKKPWIHKVSL